MKKFEESDQKNNDRI